MDKYICDCCGGQINPRTMKCEFCGTQYDTDLIEALNMAIAALEKEIPKPISIENGFVKCGGCGKYIRFPIMDHYNNCPECGQKILWKGDTE